MEPSLHPEEPQECAEGAAQSTERLGHHPSSQMLNELVDISQVDTSQPATPMPQKAKKLGDADGVTPQGSRGHADVASAVVEKGPNLPQYRRLGCRLFPCGNLVPQRAEGTRPGMKRASCAEECLLLYTSSPPSVSSCERSGRLQCEVVARRTIALPDCTQIPVDPKQVHMDRAGPATARAPERYHGCFQLILRHR